MTEIKIMKLLLENFKCHNHFELLLNGGNASIFGSNYAGKSSVYDALTWLLFDKSNEWKSGKDFEVKPLGVDGSVLDHDALTSVEAVLDVNGVGMTLKRTYKERWSTKRGSSQATYDGNTSEYFVDGVPMKQNAFQEAVRKLVDENTFMMLTSVGYFASQMDWKKRREALFRLAGIEDDRMILCTDERFKPILEAMGNGDLEGLKRKLGAEKKGLSVSKNELPTRISECRNTVASLSGLDFAGANAEKQELEQECDRISGQILGLGMNAELRNLRADLRDLEGELSRISHENELYRKNQLSGNVDVLALNMRVTGLENLLVTKRNGLESERKYIALMNSKVEGFRREWMGVNEEVFSVNSVCPTCGQDLPALQLQVARDSWEERKQQRLAQIKQNADTAKESMALAEERFKALEEELRATDAEVASFRQQIADANANRVEPKDMDGFAEAVAGVRAKMEEVNGKIFDLTNNTAAVRQKLEAELLDKKHRLAEVVQVIGKESMLRMTEERIESLKADAQRAAEALERVDGLLFLMEEYTRYKTTFVEDTINGMFRLAKFRLYRDQANGGVEDRCDVVLKENGVPYWNASTSEKMNLGMDIINTLSNAYGVRVPLFVDNAESVTNLEHCHSQRVRLVVSENDKELRVSYEN